MQNPRTIKPAIWLTLFLDSAALSVALPIIPKLVERAVQGNIPLAASYYGLLLAMSGVLLFLFGPVQAALSDHFGRKKLLVAASFGSAVSFLALAAAPNLLLLFLAQALYAITGASQPVASCFIAELSRPADRTKNFSLLSGVLTFGFIIGASVGGMLGQTSLSLAMNVAASTCLLAVAMTLFFFDETKSVAKVHRASLKLHSANPIESSKFLFSRANLAELSVVMVCGDFAFQAFLSTWVLFTTLRYHWTISQAGASLALEGLFSVVVQVALLRWALPRLGVRKTLLASLMFDALALLLYNFIDGSMIVVAVIAMHCIGSAVKPTCTAALSQAVLPAEQAKLQGAIGSQSALSSVAASLLGTSLFSYFTSAAAPTYFPGISMLVGFSALAIAMCVGGIPIFAPVMARKFGELQLARVHQSSKR